MAIIFCPSCGKQVSSRAIVCPYCDATIHQSSSTKPTNTYTNRTISNRVFSIVAAVLLVISPCLNIYFQAQSIIREIPPNHIQSILETWFLVVRGNLITLIPRLIVLIVLIIGKRNFTIPVSLGILLLTETYSRLYLLKDGMTVSIIPFIFPSLFFASLAVISCISVTPKFENYKDRMHKFWVVPSIIICMYIIAYLILYTLFAYPLPINRIIDCLTTGIAGTLMMKWIVQKD